MPEIRLLLPRQIPKGVTRVAVTELNAMQISPHREIYPSQAAAAFPNKIKVRRNNETQKNKTARIN